MSLYPIELFYQSIQNEQYFKIGSFKKPTGTEGGLVASFVYPLDHTELMKLPALFVEIDHVKVPYCIEHSITTEAKTIIRLALIRSKTEAYALRNLPLFLPLALKPKWTKAALPYSLVDGLVQEVVVGPLGIIQAIYCVRDQYMMAVNHHGKELLIPYGKPFLVNIDEVTQQVTVQLPEGYLEAML
ncbi:hypothetical protein [Cardinium endosymbiont of Philonthus spinipes]|uniref:hypothetical protein n=1 Tax=Cardinium endosymbiont of Philonthus spinipes TaxID=3077941 RepID=UPI00313BAB28